MRILASTGIVQPRYPPAREPTGTVNIGAATPRREDFPPGRADTEGAAVERLVFILRLHVVLLLESLRRVGHGSEPVHPAEFHLHAFAPQTVAH